MNKNKKMVGKTNHLNNVSVYVTAKKERIAERVNEKERDGNGV